MASDQVKRLVRFIAERERIRKRRAAGFPKPWTTDAILQRYRFCNVHRNDDTVTQWIHEHWLDPAQHHEDVWFAMAVARFVNWPESLRELTLPLPWRRGDFVDVLSDRLSRGEKTFTGAYMIRVKDLGVPKPIYLADHVLGPAWAKRKLIRPRAGDSLHQFAARLQTLHDFGSFMTGQVVADAKQRGLLLHARDLNTWAISGPGSRRGLNRVRGFELKQSWKEEEWYRSLAHLAREVASSLQKHDIKLDNQDLQNCLCEFDKYERTRLGQGLPRSLFSGT